jgi:plastocyanin
VTVRVATWATTLAVALCIVGVAASGRAVPKTHTVTIEGMRFQPQTLTVSRGDTIVWVNKDVVPHTATSKAGGFDSKTIQVEGSWEYTAGTKGEFAYICAFHPVMKATLRVQ